MLGQLIYHRVFMTDGRLEWKLIAHVSALDKYADPIITMLRECFGVENIKVMPTWLPA